jgi:glycosyltransferase involved in cell wall biosynthesis
MKTHLSIIIPYYEGEQHIMNCIRSVYSSYIVSGRKILYEIIIVIDSWEDIEYLSGIVASYLELIDINIIKNERNIGVASSREVGLRYAKYDYLAFIDQDDELLMNYFRTVENEINSSIDILIFNGYYRYTSKDLNIPIFYKKPKFKLYSILNKWTNIPTPGLIIFKRGCIGDKIFLDVTDQYKGCDDWAAYLNIILENNKLKVKYISKKLFMYCIHDSNFSHNHEQMRLSSINVLKYFKERASINYPHYAKVIERHIKIRELKYKLKYEHQNVFLLAFRSPIISIYAIINYIFIIDQHFHKISVKIK